MIDLPGLSWGIVGALAALLALRVLLASRRSRPVVLRFSGLASVRAATGGRRPWAEALLRGLRVAVIGLLVLALFRPRSGRSVEELLTPGVDIVVAMDLSDSMRAEDMGQRTRLEAARDVVAEFVKSRVHDRVGLVVFASRAFTQCPLTTDYALVERLVSHLDTGQAGEGSTAMGMGLATALNRLKDSAAKSKLVILVTDGRSNTGAIEPTTAAELAHSLGVRVYTVGVGGKGPAPIKLMGPFGQMVTRQIDDDLDEEGLTRIARTTGAIFRRATDPQALKDIFAEISNLEKTPVKVREYHLWQELFLWLVAPALVLLVAELGLAWTVFRKIP